MQCFLQKMLIISQFWSHGCGYTKGDMEIFFGEKNKRKMSVKDVQFNDDLIRHGKILEISLSFCCIRQICP